MMIDEVIAYEKERINEREERAKLHGVTQEFLRDTDYKKLIVAWLEELKEYKIKEFQCHLAEQEGIGIGYKQAIDRFLKESIKSFADFELKHGYPTLDDCTMILGDVVKKLNNGSEGDVTEARS